MKIFGETLLPILPSGVRSLMPFTKPYYRIGGIGIIALFCASSLLMLAVWYVGYLVDNIASNGASAINVSSAATFLALLVFLGISTAVRHFYVSILGDFIVRDIRRDLFEKLITKDLWKLQLGTVGEEINRLIRDSQEVHIVFSELWSITIRNSFIFVVGITALCFLNIHLLVTSTVIGPLVVIVLFLWARRVGAAASKVQSEESVLAGLISTTVLSIETIRSSAQEKPVFSRFSGQLSNLLFHQLKMKKDRSVMNGLIVSIVFGGISIVLWYGSQLVVDGTMTGGDYARFVGLFVMVAFSLDALSSVYAELNKANASAIRIMEYLEEPHIEPTCGSAFPKLENVTGKIDFVDVNFGYPPEEQNLVLKSFNLSMRAGERIALVGKSGSGKSTVLKLLLRLYVLKSGKILLDDQEIDCLDSRSLRREIAVIHQDTVIFPGTIGENIAFGLEGIEEIRIKEAAKAAQIEEFVESLPEGYRTLLGEGGVTLSGGQKQRIAIARAFLSSAKIVLMDEPTSSLDSITELAVQKAVKQTMKNKTVITIAHRLSTVIHSDRILLLENGMIVDQGSHKELMDRSVRYQALASIQFANLA